MKGGISPLSHSLGELVVQIKWLIDDSTAAGCELLVIVIYKGETRIVARERRELCADAIGVTGRVYGELCADDTGEYALAKWEDNSPLPIGARVIGEVKYV